MREYQGERGGEMKLWVAEEGVGRVGEGGVCLESKVREEFIAERGSCWGRARIR